MSPNDGLRQAAVRAATGTALTYEGDWHALFDQAGIQPGPFNGRLLAWLNAKLSTSYAELDGAMNAFAVSQGAPSWSALGTFTLGPPPIVDLNFAAGTYAENGTSYALASLPGWSFSRTAAGYAQSSAGLTLFASGQPRITDQGLLVEGAATNLLLQSQTLASATWSKLNATLTNAATTAPDGAATGCLFNEGSATGTHAVYQAVAVTAGQTVTASAYIKAGTLRYVQLVVDNGTNGLWVTVDTQTMQITEQSTVGSGVVQSSSISPQIGATGWYRVTVTGHVGALTSYAVNIMGANVASGAGAGPSYTGSSRTVYVWGLQTETAASASSYIPTTTASVTRDADTASISYSGGTTATVNYTGGTANPSAASPLNFGASSGGAWVGSSVSRAKVQ